MWSETGPDTVMVRASASGAGGCGFDPGPRHTKDRLTLKMVSVATLLGAHHYKASTGFSSPLKMYSITDISCLNEKKNIKKV